MKTTICLNGKRITRKDAAAIFGTERLEKYISEARDGFRIDPWEEQSWYTSAGMLTISFD